MSRTLPGSYSPWANEDDEVRVEQVCSVCRGSGVVVVHDQETDCIECEGFGSVVI